MRNQMAGELAEMSYEGSFSYILRDKNQFSDVEYKILQSNQINELLSCMKVFFNGDIQLYYIAHRYKSFSEVIRILDQHELLKVVCKMVASIIKIKEHGFLSLRNVELSFDKIFMEPKGTHPYFVYVPVKSRLYEDESLWQDQFRTSLAALIKSNVEEPNDMTDWCVEQLENKLLTMEQVYARFCSKDGTCHEADISELMVDLNQTPLSRLKLVAINSSTPFELNVLTDDFIIGKKPELVDGVISFNRMISRSHCKIIERNHKYMVMDLNSANGTFLNGMRLTSNRAYAVKDGDVLRLANSDFRIDIK